MACTLPPTLPPTALVTGAGRRIGREIALSLAADGIAVAVHCHTSTTEAHQVVAEIEANGGKAIVVQANLARDDETESLFQKVTNHLGPIGILVNNASTFTYDDVVTATRDSWDHHMETNLRAPFVLAQSMASTLDTDQQGCIVNIIDQRVWNLTPHFMTYTLSKAGLWALTQTLALALSPRIRVNAIGPGPTLPSSRQTEEQFRSQCDNVPLHHGTNPSEIADAVRFLVAARSMTGQMIALDGGQHLGWSFPAPGTPPEE
ncbi:SDR family oxidoreductase [Haematospirillum jordaniae]|uniref:SDR family oxidoreductase n=1 Tax=Haematospirillum jordaniae TaxID=1549855 RepID=UPI002AC3167C|nr:SDR family oxidoreductase [Haematospirillum jordaniae]